MKEIADEEAHYKDYPLPKFYDFGSVEEKEQTLYRNFLKVDQDVEDMISEIQKFNVK